MLKDSLLWGGGVIIVRIRVCLGAEGAPLEGNNFCFFKLMKLRGGSGPLEVHEGAVDVRNT